MDRKDFSDLLDSIRDKIIHYKYTIISHDFSETNFGNFVIVFSNGLLDFRIFQDKGQTYFETKLTKNNEWELITNYISKNYHGSTLSLDFRLHKLYDTDFSVETNLKFIDKVLSLMTDK